MATLNVNFVFALLVTHWVADFVCQDRWMATNKCNNIKALSCHVILYTLVLGLLMALTSMFGDGKVVIFLIWVFLNGALHFVIDFFTSKATKYLWTIENQHCFFTMIGFDQLIHYGCLLYSFSWLYK
jgi:hypothetical protein